MTSTALDLSRKVADRLGPGPGSEQFFIEEIATGIYAWHLVNETGERLSPLQASAEWKAYAKRAVEALKKPEAGPVLWDSEAKR